MSSIEGQAIDSIIASDDPVSIRSRRPLSRPRPVLSCLRCRRRKIRCDRILPCGQCTLTGHARQCSYSTRPKSDDAGSSRARNRSISGPALTDASLVDPRDSNHRQATITVRTESEDSPKAETLLSLQQRLQKLEQICTPRSFEVVKPPSHHENGGRETESPMSKVDAVLSIKPSGPRYHSQSYKKSLFHHFGVANRFCHTGFDDPERAPAMNELKMYHERYTKARKKSDVIKSPCCTLSPILESLPSRTVCDEYVSIYFRSFEKNMRILHYPSFMDEYQRFWESGETTRQEFELYVPQMAAVVAIIRSWDDESTPGAERAVKADVLWGYVDMWLDKLPGRRQLTITALRTRALLILAQQVRGVQADKIWNATGKLVRSAMMAGLHRDPSEFPNINIYEGELRRRLWMAIVEMDLEASLIYGMPVMLHEGNFTCNAPSNVDDFELFDGMTELPMSKPLEDSTDSIFQVVLVGSLVLRLQGITESGSRVENVQARIHALERYLQNLPPKLRLDNAMKDDFGQIFGIVMLNVYIRRVTAHLCRSSISPTDLAPEVTTTGLQSSLSILSYQKYFDPESPRSDSSQCGKYWDLFHILCKSDIMQAALDVSLHAQIEGLVSWTRAGLLLAIDDTTASLMRRISRNGSDIKDVLRLAVISRLLKSQFMHVDSEDMMREAMHNVVAACRRATRVEICNGEDRNNMTPPSPNTQLAMENGNSPIDWAMMPNDLPLANNDLESYFNTDGANFDFLSHYTLDNIHSDIWN
ncbi:hypothetical protein B7463_g3494, partial [Scytalidium lignicola]